MILLIDNYDSFSYNLYQLIGSIDSDICVIRNNEKTIQEIETLQPSTIVISPGPGRPRDAGICEEAVRFFKGKIPIIGVCLGHQAICEAYGGTVTYAKQMMHGKTSMIQPNVGSVIFKSMTEPVKIARYHSLAVLEETLPKELKVVARTLDGEVMAVEDMKNRVYGLQFHPESVLTPEGGRIMRNLL